MKVEELGVMMEVTMNDMIVPTMFIMLVEEVIIIVVEVEVSN